MFVLGRKYYSQNDADIFTRDGVWILTKQKLIAVFSYINQLSAHLALMIGLTI